MKKPLTIFFALLIFAACQNSSEKSETQSTVSENPEQLFNLTPFSTSPDYSDASIESYTYNEGNFSFVVGGESYKLGAQTADAESKMCANSAQGQHLHIIIDNEPYAAKYEPVFDYDIPDGEHYLLAFLSRSYHESIKTPAAHVAQAIEIKDRSIVSSSDVELPFLFYSRPKGTYVGKKDTEKVMLDFYLVNADIANYSVQVEINGEEHLINTWKPFYIEGLPMGDNSITLTLLDKDGNIADVPLNPITRSFTLKADPAEELD